MPADVLVIGASGVVLCSVVVIETSLVLRVLPIPVVLMELMEPVELVDVI